MKNQIMTRTILAAIICLCLADCNHKGSNQKPMDGEGGTSMTDTNPAVITPPAHDTSAVKTTPPSPDSNVVNPDSMGTSR